MRDKSPAEHQKFLKKNCHKLVRDLLNEDYHGITGCWSSSQFKDILDDEEVFINKYIKRTIPRAENEAFNTGTYFHTAVLEPHKIDAEIAMFPDRIRRGVKWEKFKKLNANKCIITPQQKEQGDMMAKAVKNSPTAMGYLTGEAEVSLFTEILIHGRDIYAPKYGMQLTRSGWVHAPKQPTTGHRIIVKVRADMLGDLYVSDLKSTSGNARNKDSIRGSISKYKYDLSAALYLDMFTLAVPSVREFIWIFASKGMPSCGTWRASADQILVGRAKYMRAMFNLADCAQANWEVVDCLREAEPLPWEREWLIEKETDLL